jgi:DNA primase
MIAEDKVQEIRDRASVLEVVSDHLTLRKVGRNYIGLCPFHAEKTPSFTVNDEKGIFHCFGCGVGGNVFNFLMQLDRLTFPEAVERVARRYGIAVERSQRAGSARDTDQRESLYRINEHAAAYFHKSLLAGGEGKKALAYLKSRGVDEETARRFLVGYAPSSGGGLIALLKREGVSLSDAARLGLVQARAADRYTEKFFDRLMFPIFNPAGKVAGFGGRVITDGTPKYLNSAETPLFRKGTTLYGLHQARDALRQSDRVVVVEGYLDVLALAQFGVRYVVATLGTALTPDQVLLLARYTKNVIVLFDGDAAGRKAAARSFEVFIEGELLGRAGFIPEGEDPDSYVRSKGSAALEHVVDEAVPLADCYFRWLQSHYGSSLEGKSQMAREINRVLAKVRNPLEADLLARRAAESLGVREELLRRSDSAAAKPVRREAPVVAAQSPEDRAEGSLLTALIRLPSLAAPVAAQDDMDRLLSRRWLDLLRAVAAQWERSGGVDVAQLAQGLSPQHASELAALALEGEALDEDEAKKILTDCLLYLRRRYLRGLEKDLRQAIRLAEERNDENTRRERMREWQEVVKQGRELERERLLQKTEAR